MTVSVDPFIAGLPKAELHLHIEGTLERSLCAELAMRNGMSVPNVPPFHDLTTFLIGYYASMQVLLVEADFYDLAMAYFRKARSTARLRSSLTTTTGHRLFTGALGFDLVEDSPSLPRRPVKRWVVVRRRRRYGDPARPGRRGASGGGRREPDGRARRLFPRGR